MLYEVITILKIVPEDAEVTNCVFDANTGEVIIESKKPGLVIGKEGSTLEDIKKAIQWAPKPVRTPPIPSDTIKAVITSYSIHYTKLYDHIQPELGEVQ